MYLQSVIWSSEELPSSLLDKPSERWVANAPTAVLIWQTWTSQSLQIGTVSKNIKRKHFPDSWRAGVFCRGNAYRGRGTQPGSWALSLLLPSQSPLLSENCISIFYLPAIPAVCRKHWFAQLQISLPASRATLLRGLCLQHAVGSGPVFMHGAGQHYEFLPREQLSSLQKKPRRGCTNTGTQLVLYSLSYPRRISV